MKRLKIIGSSRELYKNPVWVKSFRDTANGRGHLEITEDVEEALAFPGLGEALEFWKQQSKYVPRRDDGKPNRPLTAYTVEIE